MNAKMNVMQAKIEQRNKALQKKEMDNLRLVLLKKKDEAINMKRREEVQDRLVERLISKQEKDIEAAKAREKQIQKSRLEKAINQLETDIVRENSSIGLYDRADQRRIMQRQRAEQKMLYDQRRRMSGSQSLDVDDNGVPNMDDYLASRKVGLEQWEAREGQLLDKLKNTVTKQSKLSRKLMSHARGKSDLVNQTQFDKIDLLNVNINDIVNGNGHMPGLHSSGWRD